MFRCSFSAEQGVFYFTTKTVNETLDFGNCLTSQIREAQGSTLAYAGADSESGGGGGGEYEQGGDGCLGRRE